MSPLALPHTLVPGQPEDATQLMANLEEIRDYVNALETALDTRVDALEALHFETPYLICTGSTGFASGANGDAAIGDAFSAGSANVNDFFTRASAYVEIEQAGTYLVVVKSEIDNAAAYVRLVPQLLDGSGPTIKSSVMVVAQNDHDKTTTLLVDAVANDRLKMTYLDAGGGGVARVLAVAVTVVRLGPSS